MKKILLISSFTVFIFCGFLAGQSRDISKVGPVTEKVDLTKYNQIFYVSKNVGSDKDGTGSQTKPWATITYTLNKITNNAENNKVALIVAEGVYTGGTIQMKSFVDIFGGFKDGSWGRDIYGYPTILDGNYSRRVVIGADDSQR